MKRSLVIFLFACSAIATPQQSESLSSPAVAAAAKQGLQRFRRIYQETKDNKLGIASVEDFGKAALGAPLPVYLVRLDQLASYTGEGDPKDLLMDIHTAFFPVLVEGNTKASIRLQKAGTHWRAVAFGRPSLSKRVTEQRSAWRTAEKTSFIVEIPALNLTFLGAKEKTQLVLRALVADKELEMQQGDSRNARDIFKALAPIAKKIKPNLPQ